MRSVRRCPWAAALVMAVCLTVPARAQQYSFLQFTPRNGLAQSQVRAIAQDADGFLWVGTLGGISRYDGHSFRTLALQEGLPDAHVTALANGGQGHLWVGAGGGLLRVVGDRLIAETMPANATGARIQSLAVGQSGELYIGTDGDGLFLRDSTGVHAHPGYPVDTATHVRCVLALRDGRLLVGLRNGLLLRDHDQRFRSVPLGNDPRRAISALAEGPDGSWWVGTFQDGLFQVGDEGVIAVFDEETNLLQNTVRCLLWDDQGRLWIGTRLGLNLWDNERMRVFTVHQGMPNENVWCALQDNEGNIWFGTDGGGLLKYLGDRFITFTGRDGLCSDLVMDIIADHRGDLWLGTYDLGVCRLDAMAMITTIDGLPNNTVWCGLMTRDSALWFGTSDGLAKVRNGVVQRLPAAATLSGRRVFSLYEDGTGNIWAGTRNGLSRLSPDGTVEHFAAGAEGPGRSVRAIVSPRPGRLLMATEQGISEYGPDGFRTWTTAHGVSDNNVQCLTIDAAGRLWAGTNNGLTCRMDGTFRTIRLGADLGSNQVMFLIAGPHGEMWAGTNNGLVRFHPDSLLDDPLAFQRIGVNEGLRSLEFNLNACFMDPRGRLFLGSAGGMVFHDAFRHATLPTPPAPKVLISRVRSFLQETDWSGRAKGLDARGLPVDLRLDHRRHYLTFDYTGISLTDPEKVVYRYRLVGLDEDWLPPTHDRYASFSNLPHGDYTFEVAAALGNGPWSEPASFSFRIEPPVWSRWWFVLLVLALVAGLIMVLARIRDQRRARAEHTRQLMLRSRMLQMEQQALNANMNRHFVFNALNSIQYHINRQDRESANRYLTSFAKLIRRNLDASQSDTTSLAEELERLELYLVLERMRFKDRLQYRIQVDPTVDTRAVRLPAMMLQPYVENSIWHGILPMDRPGLVEVVVTNSPDGHVEVRIEDDGVGMEHSRRDRERREADHISRGIEITKGRADVLRRLSMMDIGIQGPQPHPRGRGTLVVVTLPRFAAGSPEA